MVSDTKNTQSLLIWSFALRHPDAVEVVDDDDSDKKLAKDVYAYASG